MMNILDKIIDHKKKEVEERLVKTKSTLIKTADMIIGLPNLPHLLRQQNATRGEAMFDW